MAHTGLQATLCGYQATTPGIQTERRYIPRQTSKIHGRAGVESMVVCVSYVNASL